MQRATTQTPLEALARDLAGSSGGPQGTFGGRSQATLSGTTLVPRRGGRVALVQPALNGQALA